MFEIADVAIAPRKLGAKCQLQKKTIVLPEKNMFSEEILEEVMKYIKYTE